MADQKISKKSWNADEDVLLLQLVAQYGLNGHWSTISTKMGNRTGKQCRERYHNHLKPDIWKGTWSQEEDDLLNESQRTMGNQWAKIAKLLPGRSDNSVKNRWHIINRKKNQSEESSAVCVTVDTSKACSRPVIPKLALGVLSSAEPSRIAIKPEEEDCDLLSFYYSHDSHAHCRNATDSTRTNASIEAENCPGSGRRDYSTSSAPSDSFDDEFDCDEAFDALLEDADNDGMMSFGNTLSSCLSELTSNTVSFPEDDDLMTSFEREEDFQQHRYGAPAINIDRFSEPALSFRDMDSVLDDLANATDAGDFAMGDEEFGDDSDLLLFDLMDECTMQNTASNASPNIRSVDKKTQLNMFVNMLQQYNNGASSGNIANLPYSKSSQSIRDFSPRTTPRSPMCPHVKKQRAGRTPRSPYQVVLRVI